MKIHLEQASTSNMEDAESSSPNKGKGFDVVGSDSDSDYTNTERDDKLSASNKGKDIAIISSISNPEIKIEMTSKNLEKLKDKIRVLPPEQNPANCCIFRVPNSIRNVESEAYTPQLISIGPLHSGNEKLKDMEKQKLRYFKDFVEQAEKGWVKIEYLWRGIMNNEADIRACYSENFNKIESNDFIEMILLDAVFIIEFFQRSNDDPFLKTWMIFDIREDLMLLENQLPFFIIKKIYEEANYVCHDRLGYTFLKLATDHFGKYMFSQEVQSTDPDDEQETKHFTDLIRSFMLKGSIERNFNFPAFPVKLKYNAVMLRQAGMKFQVTEDKCLVNITFEEGVLKIPRLEVDYCFERVVRNIMAFEQCFKPFEPYVCNYIMFMDHLIDSAKDVDLLSENRIIHNLLGDHASLSGMINKLCVKIPDTHTCYDDICGKMNAHYENRWNHRKATLKLVYFPNIWRGTATVAAAILLILTFIQTIKAFL